MKYKHIVTAAVTAFALVGAAHANVSLVGSQAAFTAAGTVSQNTNWDSYGAGFSFPGSPFTVGNETFVQGASNLIGGVGTGYNLARNLLTDNNVAGTTIDLSGQFNLFAVNAGNFLGAATETFTVTTNLGTYSFAPTVSNAVNLGALTFVGFEAGQGEYFQSIQFTGSGATGVTDVQIGSVSTVPEPASMSLMLMGLAGVGAAVRSRRKNTGA